MKKLIALAALAACLPTFAGTVESSNTVGYTKITLTPGYNMVSPMFNAIGGDVKAIKDIFEEKTGWVAADTDADADYIRVWYNGGYKFTYFVSTDVNDDGAWANGEDSYTETEDTIPENVGFWLYNRGSQKTVTLAGEVPDDDVSLTLIPGYTMLANPFAAPLPIKSIVATSGEFVGADTDADADYIRIWRNGGYAAVYFVSTDADDNGAWANGEDSYTETDDTIAPGEAFWFYRRGSTMTITIPCPN